WAWQGKDTGKSPFPPHLTNLLSRVCLAFYESHFDSALVDHEADGSTSNGIFQINSHMWCEDYKHRKPNVCQMHCSDLLTSNINDDIVCAMRIAQGPREKKLLYLLRWIDKDR
uniref:Glycosyl hydrolases family 22 (GH22) domain-containing protein n=1 Tax=Laticauda laticaudata TaxID=8630 RepID=A0A8C5SAY5_LATLA